LKPDPGREVWRDPEYVRTTTGWLVTVVRLDVDFADLLLAGDEWKAGALRARRAADWVTGSVFVKVVVALGTEPVLSARSVCPPCVSKKGSWVVTVGIARMDELDSALGPGRVFVPQSVEKTPSATDCLVVVAGVNVGGRAPESATAGAWWFEGGAKNSASAGI
jgi:hypothetical protein